MQRWCSQDVPGTMFVDILRADSYCCVQVVCLGNIKQHVFAVSTLSEKTMHGLGSIQLPPLVTSRMGRYIFIAFPDVQEDHVAPTPAVNWPIFNLLRKLTIMGWIWQIAIGWHAMCFSHTLPTISQIFFSYPVTDKMNPLPNCRTRKGKMSTLSTLVGQRTGNSPLVFPPSFPHKIVNSTIQIAFKNIPIRGHKFPTITGRIAIWFFRVMTHP